MASSSKKGGGDMKGFYREKKGLSVKKPTTKLTSSSNSSFSATATAKPKTHSAATSSISDEYDHVKEEEVALRQFDMNMKYGPCLGMSRLARWERASKLGMNPPPHIERLLKLPNACPECLWEGRV